VLLDFFRSCKPLLEGLVTAGLIVRLRSPQEPGPRTHRFCSLLFLSFLYVLSALRGEIRNARRLEDCKLHVQKLFRVLSEFRPKSACSPRGPTVVVELGVLKTVRSRLIGIQLCRRTGRFSATWRYWTKSESSVASFPRFLSPSNIRNKRIAVIEQLLRAVIQFRFIHEFTQRALLGLHGFEHIIEAARREFTLLYTRR